MSGLQPIRIQQSGQMLIKVAVVTLLASLILSACSADWWVGDGRGDWTLDLYGGYAIAKINSNEILVVHKEDPNDTGGTIVLPNYFVISYQLHEPYIFIEGISTQGRYISEEELSTQVSSYYIIDTVKGEIIGPHESYDDFVENCNVLGLKIVEKWITIDRNASHAS